MLDAEILSKSAEENLLRLQALPAGWDGPGTPAIHPAAIDAAREALRALAACDLTFHEPVIVPKFDGLLQLEWNDSGWSLELELLPERWEVLGVRPSPLGPEYHSADVELLDYQKLRRYYDWWAERRGSWIA